MEIYVKYFISIFLIFSGFQIWFYHMSWFFTRNAASNTAVMTSQIRSHIEYLIQTYYILLPILYSKFMKNLALMTVFNTI